MTAPPTKSSRKTGKPPVAGLAPIAPRARPWSRHSRMSRLLHYLDSVRKIILNIGFAALVALLVSTLYRVLSTDQMTIDPISLPKNIKELGYSEDAAAMQITNNMLKISKDAQSGAALPLVKSKMEAQDVTVPVAGLSIDDIIRLIRETLGWPQRRVIGEFVCPTEPCNVGTVELRLRMLTGTATPAFIDPIKGASPDKLLVRAAEEILKLDSPLVAMAYLYGKTTDDSSRRAEVVAVAESMIANNHPDKKWAYNYIGNELFDRPSKTEKDLNDAINNFREVAALDPSLAQPLINWGASLSALGHPQDAIEKYDEALKLDPNEPTALSNKGGLLKGLGKFDEALAVLEKARDLNPNDAMAINNIGSVYSEQGKNAEAAEAYKRALALSPDLAEPQFNLGVANQKLNKFPEAIAAFETYLEKNPHATDRSTVEGLIAQMKQ